MNIEVAGGAGAIASALGWIQGVLLGTIGTTIAVMAVAYIGVLMLGGRIDTRRSIQIVLGCFMLFGASTIAAGIRGAVGSTGDTVTQPEAAPLPPVYPPTLPTRQNSAEPFDPYAGASIQQR